MRANIKAWGWEQLARANTVECMVNDADTNFSAGARGKPDRSRWLKELALEYGAFENLAGLFFSNASENPDDVAVVCDGESLSHAELANIALQVALYLRHLGCSADDCVGLFVEPSLEQIIGVWGIILSGSAYLPIAPGQPPERLRFMVEDIAMKFAFSQKALSDQCALLVSEGVKVVTLEEVYAFSASLVNGHTQPALRIRPQSLAYIVYTSGSTGRPKGVLIEHHSVVNQMRWLASAGYLGRHKTIIHKTPIIFDAAQWEMLSVCCGSRLVISRFGVDKNINNLIDEIMLNEVTLLQCVPTLLQALVNKSSFANCVTLTHILSGAESLTKKLVLQCIDMLPGCVFVNLYGPAECTCNASFYEVVPEVLRQNISVAIPIGTPVANTQFYILDDVRAAVPDGCIGELYVSGAQTARGYLNQAALTDEKFFSHTPTPGAAPVTVYRTGDLACLSSEGIYSFAGRRDTQVKIKGMRVELEEVKVVLESFELIGNAAVLVYDNQDNNNRLVACVQLSDKGRLFQQSSGDSQLTSHLRKELAQLIPDYMIPDIFIFSETIPLTVSGKIDMRKIQSLAQAHIGVDVVAPKNATEQAILELWRRSLRIDRVSVTDNFFAVGGDSMSAVDIIVSINQRFSLQLPLHALIGSPTIEALADVVDKGVQDISGRLVCLQPLGAKPPIFCWPGLGGYPLHLKLLAEKIGDRQPFYGIQAYGINTGETPYLSLEEMALADIAQIRRVQEHGPYTFWGYSFGTQVAFEAARQLEAMGETVEKIVLIAPGMVKGLAQISDLDGYENPDLIALLFTVFSRNVNDPALDACLRVSNSEDSFADFICQTYSIANVELVKQISRVVIASLRATGGRSPAQLASVTAPGLVFSALNDHASFFEMRTDCFKGGMQVINVEATHFHLLSEPGINPLISHLAGHISCD